MAKVRVDLVIEYQGREIREQTVLTAALPSNTETAIEILREGLLACFMDPMADRLWWKVEGLLEGR